MPERQQTKQAKRDRYEGTFWCEDGERAWFPVYDEDDRADGWHASEALIEFVRHDVDMVGDDDLIWTDYRFRVTLTWGVVYATGDGDRIRPIGHPDEANGEVQDIVRVGQFWEVTNAA